MDQAEGSPEDLLAALVRDLGPEALSDARACTAYLRDMAPQETAAIHVLSAALEEDIPRRLRSGHAPALQQAAMARALASNRGLSEDSRHAEAGRPPRPRARAAPATAP